MIIIDRGACKNVATDRAPCSLDESTALPWEMIFAINLLVQPTKTDPSIRESELGSHGGGRHPAMSASFRFFITVRYHSDKFF
jgi:hypothetical protein